MLDAKQLAYKVSLSCGKIYEISMLMKCKLYIKKILLETLITSFTLAV